MPYSNPWRSYEPISIRSILQSMSFGRKDGSIPPAKWIPVTRIADCHSVPESLTPRMMWLGHASVFLQLPRLDDDGQVELLGVLFDPIFSERCSPLACIGIGPKRRLPPPCAVRDLPPVHLVVISHDHYDHLDQQTLRDLERYHRETVMYAVPSGVKEVLNNMGIPREVIRELGWWDESIVNLNLAHKTSFSLSAEEKKEPLSSHMMTKVRSRKAQIRLACTPAQHNSGRGIFQRNKTLWATWVLEYVLPDGSSWTCFFGGDTGFRSKDVGPTCRAFKQISNTYGRPSLALLPVTHGSVLPYLSSIVPVCFNPRLVAPLHCSPKDAVDIHMVMGAKRSFAIHWGTWTSVSEAQNTLTDLEYSCVAAGVDFTVESHRHEREYCTMPEGMSVAEIGVWLDVP